MTSRRRTSRRLHSNARRAASKRKPKGHWRITVKGKTTQRKFRSSAKMLAYAKEKYGRGFKWGWKAD